MEHVKKSCDCPKCGTQLNKARLTSALRYCRLGRRGDMHSYRPGTGLVPAWYRPGTDVTGSLVSLDEWLAWYVLIH